MSSAVSSANVPSTPILVTTPTTDTKASFNDHRRDDSSDDQRQLNKQNLNKTYTRVRILFYFIVGCTRHSLNYVEHCCKLHLL